MMAKPEVKLAQSFGESCGPDSRWRLTSPEVSVTETTTVAVLMPPIELVVEIRVVERDSVIAVSYDLVINSIDVDPLLNFAWKTYQAQSLKEK
jgi:hypothetical protein